MIERFQGSSNRPRLIEAIKAQAIVRGDEGLAHHLCDRVELREFDTGYELISQGSSDDDLYLILFGAVSVTVNGHEVAIRTKGQHVGEMALIDPSAPRAATVTTIEPTVVARISETSFAEIAQTHSELWRLIALFLGERLRQRNELVAQKNPRPVIFIGSSRETLPVAREIQSCLRYDDFVVRVWTDGVFGASTFPIDDLQGQLRTADFAVLVLGPEDQVTSRGITSDAPRDNVVFELGLFMGSLGRHRTFLVSPLGVAVKIPSDILGLTPLTYKLTAPGDLTTAIAPLCNDLRKIIMSTGPK
ncbi:MAG TPA: cyclic nucleotide-binding protein [Blastocatellia bacterium]|nr:cyclic nucleotide-binding protein [Blastocatellia bacterium]